MYPAQTSLMPIQIALARFVEQGGNVFGNYPFWYLGTTPFRYLTGPFLPFVLNFLHRALPNFSLFEIFFLIIGVFWVIGTGGVYLLVKELKGEKMTAVHSALFYLFGLIIPLLFRFSNGLYLIAFSFLPYLLILYSNLLRKRTLSLGIVLSLLISFMILVDSLILPTLVVGMAAIFLVQVGWKKAEEKLKSSLLLLFFGILIATLWYTPGYWLILFGAPSLAGKGLLSVVVWLGKLLPTALAFGIAILSVKFFKKKDLLRDFCLYWLFIFGFLTLLRFLSDPDFWLDWIAYGTELQFGLAILFGLLFELLTKRVEKKKASVILVLASLLLIVVWLPIFNQAVLGTLQPNITQTIEYKLSKQISETASSGERVFLSGTTAFWLNAFFDIPQVRGGVDQASTDPNWRKATWELREGTNPEKSVKWLKDLDVSYLVVHTEESKEFYHDFTSPEKFEKAEGLKRIYDEEGDWIYRVLD